MLVSSSISHTDIQVCTLCGKPMGSAGLKRHKAYCRRSKNRPNPRRKSCRACNAAKAKCSFESPCSRCQNKGIDCVYPTTPAPSQTAATASPLIGGSEFEVSSLNFDMDEEVFPSEEMATSAYNFLDNDQFVCLTRLERADSFAQHNASLIIDAFCAMPMQMTRRETFPCFIHPHWGRSLPESLVICMHLAQMYASRTMEVRPFMWRSILAEQTRVMQELSSITREDLLAAIQAHTIYMIMRVADRATSDPSWNWEMARASRVLCDRFIEMCNDQFCEDEISNPTLSWEDWIFAESRRRTSSIWFLISQTVVIMTRSDCATTEAPWTLPLPSPKTQWEARTEDIWLQEVGIVPSLNTLGDLVECKKGRNQNLDIWNATSDSLGFLLNLAVDMLNSPRDDTIAI